MTMTITIQDVQIIISTPGSSGPTSSGRYAITKQIESDGWI